MPRTIFLFILLVTLLVTGCRRLLSTPEPLKPPTPEKLHATNLPVLGDAWAIKMIHSGGIMGLSRSIEISSDGKYIIVDQRVDKTVNGELSTVEVSKVDELIASAKYTSPSKPDGMVCADCFIYDLEIQGDEKKFAVQLNDISLPNSGLELLVNYLRGLMDTALK